MDTEAMKLQKIVSISVGRKKKDVLEGRGYGGVHLDGDRREPPCSHEKGLAGSTTSESLKRSLAALNIGQVGGSFCVSGVSKARNDEDG